MPISFALVARGMDSDGRLRSGQVGSGTSVIPIRAASTSGRVLAYVMAWR
jgi:hypothetical protein